MFKNLNTKQNIALINASDLYKWLKIVIKCVKNVHCDLLSYLLFATPVLRTNEL